MTHVTRSEFLSPASADAMAKVARRATSGMVKPKEVRLEDGSRCCTSGDLLAGRWRGLGRICVTWVNERNCREKS
jgi:hypothetical protein